MNSAVLVIGLPEYAFEHNFSDWHKLESYHCIGENTDPSEVIYGLEVVEACESYKPLRGTQVILKMAELKKQFKEITGKEGWMVLTPHKDDL